MSACIDSAGHAIACGQVARAFDGRSGRRGKWQGRTAGGRLGPLPVCAAVRERKTARVTDHARGQCGPDSAGEKAPVTANRQARVDRLLDGFETL